MKNFDSLLIKNFRVGIPEKEIIKGINLKISPGEIHAIMGPNGSGKSTLVQAIMGNPFYVIKQNNEYKYHTGKVKSVLQIGKTVFTDLSPDNRAKLGIFLAFQSPIAIPGISVINLLRTAYQEIYSNKEKEHISKLHNPVIDRRFNVSGMGIMDFIKLIENNAAKLSLDSEILNRGVHDGFSGGERKKIEMLEALVLKPKFAMFDEIDTGLDVDALKLVAGAILELSKAKTGVIVVTHYRRILKYLKPDKIHILVNGKIIESGTYQLAAKIENEGYKKYQN
jgi:Fe-S cluster assembly ATP-binding protein